MPRERVRWRKFGAPQVGWSKPQTKTTPTKTKAWKTVSPPVPDSVALIPDAQETVPPSRPPGVSGVVKNRIHWRKADLKELGPPAKNPWNKVLADSPPVSGQGAAGSFPPLERQRKPQGNGEGNGNGKGRDNKEAKSWESGPWRTLDLEEFKARGKKYVSRRADFAGLTSSAVPESLGEKAFRFLWVVNHFDRLLNDCALLDCALVCWSWHARLKCSLGLPSNCVAPNSGIKVKVQHPLRREMEEIEIARQRKRAWERKLIAIRRKEELEYSKIFFPDEIEQYIYKRNETY